MDGNLKYLKVILPLKLDWEPCYSVLPGTEGGVPSVGTRVSVRFAGRQYVGVVSESDVTPDIELTKIQRIIRVEDGISPVTEAEMRLWRFVSDYYLCPVGEVYKAAYPSLKNDGEMIRSRERLRAEERLRRMNAALAAKRERLEAAVERRRAMYEKAVRPETREKYLEALTKAENALKALPLEIAAQDDSRSYARLPLPSLSLAQQTCLEQIRGFFSKKSPVLLDGVTGSGKTEVYISLAANVLDSGGSVLYMIPEIAVSKQLGNRLKEVFGNQLALFHSGMSASARSLAVEKVRMGNCIVLGTRSSVFLPFMDLGLVIVDEEHDNSYKQETPAPRYNGRDTAMMLARFHGADLLLGTATPSLESLYNCRTGRLAKVMLRERYFGDDRTVVEIVNTAEERRKRGMKGSFSYKLIDRMKEALKGGGQILLLRSRKSYSPAVQCSRCGKIPRCPHCDVSLSWHRDEGRLKCHYCGWNQPFNAVCPDCGGHLEPLGAGTQRVVEEVSMLFPDARVARIDGDMISGSAGEEAVIRDFSQGLIDILVGTQIVTKGFDFARLSLVAVLQADSLLGFQDFRADEKALQILEQFRGRVGRRGQRGLFLIQTATPEHPVYKYVASEQRSDDLAETILAERFAFGYPPFSRIIQITLRDSDEGSATSLAAALARAIRCEFGISGLVRNQADQVSVLGPYAPAVDKVSNLYIRLIRVSMMKNQTLMDNKRRLASLVSDFGKENRCSAQLSLDVDPL
ncbi:MAG: primosomal protein N' [Candidatus Cryptobacteroides sp.]|nr:primosomal protein N' [Candidatus Cryptobacteroides sp.]